MTADPWVVGRAYELYVGRWSRLVAVEFLRWLAAPPDVSWCDVGCGTGALAHTVLAVCRPLRVVGVEPSEGFAAAARAAVDDPRFEVRAGSADALPVADGEFDRVASALVLNFVPDQVAGLAEMRRATAPGGMIAGYVWDYAEGMQLIRAFWDAATELDEVARGLDEGRRFPLCRPEPLHSLLSSAGLDDVQMDPLEVPTVFADFDDYWRPFLGGQGPAPGYCMSLPEPRRLELRDALAARLYRDPDGRIRLAAPAWAFRGTPTRPMMLRPVVQAFRRIAPSGGMPPKIVVLPCRDRWRTTDPRGFVRCPIPRRSLPCVACSRRSGARATST